jgi:hypothetical protein
MLFQIDIAVEGQFLFYYIAVLLGIQIAIYCFYYYYKTRDINLKLNKVLLSIGAFTLLTIFGALFLMIVRLFDLDPLLELVLYRSGFVFVFLAPIGFMYFLVSEELTQILNINTSRILMILNLIPIVTVIILPTDNLVFRISVVFVVLDALYVILVQLRLIKISVGNIRKRLLQFFTGEVLALSALVFAANVSFNYLPISTEISFFIGTGLLVSGLAIIFLSSYEFPPFLEFEWVDNLLKFFVINQENSSILYNYDFSELLVDEALKEDIKQYFSGGLMGLDNIISTITYTKGERLKQIKHGDALILLEYTSEFPIPIIYALVVRRELNTYKYIMRNFKNQFESFFDTVLINLDRMGLGQGENQLFKSFDMIIENIVSK